MWLEKFSPGKWWFITLLTGIPTAAREKNSPEQHSHSKTQIYLNRNTFNEGCCQSPTQPSMSWDFFSLHKILVLAPQNLSIASIYFLTQTIEGTSSQHTNLTLVMQPCFDPTIRNIKKKICIRKFYLRGAPIFLMVLIHQLSLIKSTLLRQ